MDGGILSDLVLLRDCLHPYINFIIVPFLNTNLINQFQGQVWIFSIYLLVIDLPITFFTLISIFTQTIFNLLYHQFCHIWLFNLFNHIQPRNQKDPSLFFILQNCIFHRILKEAILLDDLSYHKILQYHLIVRLLLNLPMYIFYVNLFLDQW